MVQQTEDVRKDAWLSIEPIANQPKLVGRSARLTSQILLPTVLEPAPGNLVLIHP